MPRINLLARKPIVPVTVRTMRATAKAGLDPYNSRDALQARWEDNARKRGAESAGPDIFAALGIPAVDVGAMEEVEVADVFALLAVPAPAHPL